MPIWYPLSPHSDLRRRTGAGISISIYYHLVEFQKPFSPVNNLSPAQEPVNRPKGVEPMDTSHGHALFHQKRSISTGTQHGCEAVTRIADKTLLGAKGKFSYWL
jgi:hypothetical protein